MGGNCIAITVNRQKIVRTFYASMVPNTMPLDYLNDRNHIEYCVAFHPFSNIGIAVIA